MVSVGEPPVADYEPEALLALTAVIGTAASGGAVRARGQPVASAFGGPAGGAVADGLAQVRVLMLGTRRYLVFDVALPAGARKGAR